MSPEQRRVIEQSATSGLVRLWRALLPLKSTVTFLQTGAHPDDETTRMLARLRSDGIHVAFACATRGQGGQNAIGPEAGADLGLLRTAEMEAAAHILDVDLYWLGIEEDDPITDFGFSKSGEDTLRRWGAERTLERMVRAIRSLRPDILCPTFLDVGGQHGHHRAITRITEEAFHKAADPEVFPEHRALGLEPWAVAKLYLPAFSGAGGSYDDEEPPPPATLSLEVGTVDPMFGATWAQMGEWSRVRHLSQGMGHWVQAAPARVDLHLKASRLGPPGPESAIDEGLPRTLADLADRPDSPLHGAQAALDDAFAAFPNRGPLVDALVRAHRHLSAASAPPEHAHRLARMRERIEAALAEALLATADLTVEPSRFAPGETVTATLSLVLPLGFAKVGDATLLVPDGWSAEAVGQERAVEPGTPQSWRFAITAPEVSRYTGPYRFKHDSRAGLGAVSGQVRLVVHDVTVVLPVQPSEAVILGPRVSVAANPTRLPLRIGNGSAAPTVRLLAGSGDAAPNRLGLAAPAGWRAETVMSSTAGTDIRLVPPESLAPGLLEIPILLDDAPAWTVTRIAYDHTRPVEVARPALLRVLALQVEVPDNIRIGAVLGGSDRAAEDMERLGLPIAALSDADLAAGDFAGFDTILVGIFALRTRPAFKAALPRLKAWIEAGGNLVTLYHRPWDGWDPDRTVPARLAIGQPSLRWRVTDPAAPVTHLLPDHPLLNTPNRIGPEDWTGWVKERGLYFASDWAEAYQPLVAMADPGEAPHRGALLAGRFGRGRHVHVSLALHTQLAHLVPGAYRVMANLLAPPVP